MSLIDEYLSNSLLSAVVVWTGLVLNKTNEKGKKIVLTHAWWSQTQIFFGFLLEKPSKMTYLYKIILHSEWPRCVAFHCNK